MNVNYIEPTTSGASTCKTVIPTLPIVEAPSLPIFFKKDIPLLHHKLTRHRNGCGVITIARLTRFQDNDS